MRLLPIAIVFLAGCIDPAQVPDGHDFGGVDCADNNAPFIANVEMNSFQREGGDGLYILSLHFDWADPGIAGGSDRPNMSGGYISGEMYNVEFSTRWITPDMLVASCTDPLDAPGTCMRDHLSHQPGREAADRAPAPVPVGVRRLA